MLLAISLHLQVSSFHSPQGTSIGRANHLQYYGHGDHDYLILAYLVCADFDLSTDATVSC